jgi:hypothetical protein
MASMTDFLDEDALQKMFKRMDVDATNQKSMQGMAQAQAFSEAPPPPNPYAQSGQQSKGVLGTIGSIAAPLMKIGGGVLLAVR